MREREREREELFARKRAGGSLQESQHQGSVLLLPEKKIVN